MPYIVYSNINIIYIFFIHIFKQKLDIKRAVKLLFRKEKPREAIDASERFLYILNNLPDGLAIINSEKSILFINNAFGKNIRSIKKISGIKDFDFLTRNLELNKLIDSVIESKGTAIAEKKISYFDRAEEKIVQCTAFRIGLSEEFAIIVRDVTYLQKIENVRTAFIQNITHEIKTPITAIKGFVETLKNGAAENVETRNKFIDIIEHHAGRLNYLIDDLLTLTNIETGKFPLKFESINVKSQVNNSLVLFENEISEKKIDIIASGIDMEIISDPSKINQIITNLIQNAVKYSLRNGTIKIEASISDIGLINAIISDAENTGAIWNNLAHKDEKEGKFFLFSIEDSGIGVNYTNLLRLGERFFRVDSSHGSRHKGTGLGLAIVKHTIKVLEGCAIIKSSLGNGFGFTFAVPIDLAENSGMEPKE